jgi:CRP-like cAMP-binding protein
MFSRHGVPSSRIEFLSEVPFFEGLPAKALARIDTHLDEVTVPAGSVLTEQGRGAYETFIVAEGTAEVRVGNDVVGETAVGELIGEIGVLKNTLRTATVTAKTPMRLLVFGRRELDWLFDDPTLREGVRANLDKHLSEAQPDEKQG